MSSHNDSNPLVSYVLHLADNSLILAQRNAAWCGHGPVLEQDIAITNISLDLIGQARYFYQYAADLINKSAGRPATAATEDTLAYLRDVPEFRNCLLAEQLNGDWAQTILRQFFFSAYQYLLYQELQNSKDEQLAAIAAKSLKEVTYHLRWSSEWVIRLGDGTKESHDRILNALTELWPYTGELFMPADYEIKTAEEGKGVNPSILKDAWSEKIKEIFSEATIPVPGEGFQQSGGKYGKHTELLGYILTELQFMQRAYPNAIW
jgi:ring-1,2-phenylacetyl-CoA epoxidase subunit PaaC